MKVMHWVISLLSSATRLLSPRLASPIQPYRENLNLLNDSPPFVFESLKEQQCFSNTISRDDAGF